MNIYFKFSSWQHPSHFIPNFFSIASIHYFLLYCYSSYSFSFSLLIYNPHSVSNFLPWKPSVHCLDPIFFKIRISLFRLSQMYLCSSLTYRFYTTNKCILSIIFFIHQIYLSEDGLPCPIFFFGLKPYDYFIFDKFYKHSYIYLSYI